MSALKDDRLYVNVSASQARRRLQGFGHGVRKIHSAGKNQAVIIHTATGTHLQELQAVFADALPNPADKSSSIPIEHLRNLGPTSAAWLREIGVNTRDELARLGPGLAYALVRERQAKVSLNLLWALAAALADKDWRSLTKAEKESLLSEITEV